MTVGHELSASDCTCTQGRPALPLKVMVEQRLQTPAIMCRELFKDEDWSNLVKYSTLAQEYTRWERDYHPRG